jgi:putative inorganic carbon (HCO3(-)) transporter
MFPRSANGRTPAQIQKIVFVNFGGIGDEILFAPVIEAFRRALPHARTTLILEDRSQVVVDLLDGVDDFIALDIQGQSRSNSFFQLLKALRSQRFDLVISSGSNPFIPILLFLSGIPIRVGFGTGAISRYFLTVEAPLAPKHDRKGYAAVMYFALAQSFLTWLFPNDYTPPAHILPHLKPPGLEELRWVKSILRPDDPHRKIVIHPGVSAVSVQKNILKSWSPKAWAELIYLLTSAGNQVFLAGGPDDKQAVEGIQQELPPDMPHFTNLYGQTKSLKQLAALIMECDLLIGVDSSPMHIAVGYGKPVVALFGPTDEKKLLPLNHPRFKAVTMPDLTCRPCLWDTRNECCDTPVCLDVPVALVLAAVESVLPAAFR